MGENTIQLSFLTGLVIGLLVVAAVSVGAAAVGPEQEPNDGLGEAEMVPLGEEVNGELTNGDVDWFQFTAESGVVINISASTDDVGNTNFELLSTNGNQMAGISGLTAARGQTGATSTYTGTYYLRVERRFTDRGGEYSFTVETSEADSFDPNEDIGNATELTDEQEVEGELTIGDTDWFTATVEQGDSINLSAFGATDGVTNFQLYDRNETLVAGQDGVSGGLISVNHTAAYSGPYYVRVAPRFGKYGATYNLTVNLPGSPPAETDEPAQESTDSDSEFPILLVIVGVAVVLVFAFMVWRSREEDDESR